MALKILPTEDPKQDVVLRIDEAYHLDPDRASLQKVRRALAGHDPDLPYSRAMAILFASDFPNKHRDFEALLEDETAPAFARRLAAVYLGRFQTPEAVDVLVSHLDRRDESVLSAILRALGAAGGRRALEAIIELEGNLPPSATQEANVAAALIAHRLGSEGHEFPVPPDLRFLDVDRACAGRLEITPASRNDVEFCLRSLGRQPYGIELAETPAVQVRCNQHAWMVLFNRAFATPNGIAPATRYKAIAGVVATMDRETGLYAPAFVLLTTPAPADGSIRILVSRTNGQVIFGGEAQVHGTGAQFSLRATARPGAFGLSVEGTFEDGHLRIHHALTSLAAQVPRLRPVADLPPA